MNFSDKNAKFTRMDEIREYKNYNQLFSFCQIIAYRLVIIKIVLPFLKSDCYNYFSWIEAKNRISFTLMSYSQ